METYFEKLLQDHDSEGSWSCTATATPKSSDDPSDDISSVAVLSAVPATLSPSLSMASSIGEGNSTCGEETGQIWQDADLNEKMDGLDSCAKTMDGKTRTVTIDYPSCDAATAANTACSCEFVFHL